jgi:serine/threonine protein kinase
MIDGENNARLTDLGFAQTVAPVQDSSYLWTDSVLPGAAIYAAPELLCPDLYPDPKVDPTLFSDIYSFGSIFFFVRPPSVSVLQLLLKQTHRSFLVRLRGVTRVKPKVT